jgi:predicted O-linked N-acetylglucosamine transferase (SPINDLY family)
MCASPGASRQTNKILFRRMILLQEIQKAAAAFSRGDWAEAERLGRLMLKAKADHFDALTLLGIIAAQSRRTPEAVEYFRRAVAADPNNAQAHSNHGNALRELKRFDEALASCDQAIRLRPGYSEAYNNRGAALQELGRLDEALASFEQAIKFRPDNAEAHNNRGAALKKLFRLDEALASFGQAIKLDPHHADACFNRGSALLELKRVDAALASFEAVIRLKPDYMEAYYQRGHALLAGRQYLDAVQCFARLLELAPEHSLAKGALLHAKMMCCDWSGLAELHGSIRRDLSGRKLVVDPFMYQAIAESEEELRTCAEIYAAEKFPRSTLMRIGRLPRHAKVRLGYLSGEFREHAVATLMTGFWEQHDKTRFETFAFDSGGGDGSRRRARVCAAFDEMIDITRTPDPEVASLVRAKEIDILVDLSGYTGDGRPGVFRHKACPVQVNYLGFPGTTGADYFDYLIADDTVIPRASERHYAEKIARLPDSFQANDRNRAIADRRFSREELALPENGFVFCCFSRLYKITPGMFAGWMRILKGVEGSVLWLLEDNPAAALNLQKEAQARGVSASRLIFAKRVPLMEEHLARHRAADLFIDTLPYNAHTTASDALWAGLPLLTCAGQTYPGRVSASLLNAIHLPELIAKTQGEYEALAIELAANPARLIQIREKLARNRLATPLFDTGAFARHMEDLYMQMYERCQAGLPPDTIHART